MTSISAMRDENENFIGSVLRAATLLAIFFLPFELVITQGAHGLLARHIGVLFFAVHPFSAVLVCLLLTPGTFSALQKQKILIAVPIMIAGVFFSTLARGAAWEPTIQFTYFGGLSILVGAILIDGDDNYARLRTLMHGFAAWLVMIIAVYGIYAYQVGLPRPEDISHYILILRNPGPDVAEGLWFFRLAGNVNKVANYALLSSLLAYFFWGREKPLSVKFYLFQTLSIVVIFICFSRGAFVVAAAFSLGFVVSYIYDRVMFSRESRPKLVFACVMAIPVLASISTPDFRLYWTDISTVQRRLTLASEIGDPNMLYAPESGTWGGTLSDEQRSEDVGNFEEPSLIFGYGIGNYGLQHFRSAIAGTHNFFLDLWTNGGLLSSVSIIFMMAASMIVALRRSLHNGALSALIGLAGLGGITLLAFREYDIAYLWATSMGGILLGAFISLANTRRDGAGRLERLQKKQKACDLAPITEGTQP